MRILGVDPGTNFLGYAVIETNKNPPEIIVSGALNMSKIKNPYEKLETILTTTYSNHKRIYAQRNGN